VIEVTKGDRIRDLRKAKGITQIDMAKLLSTTKQTISKYEKGIVTNIPSDRIEAMARLLDTTPEYILGWEKNEEEIFADVSPEVEKNNDLIAEVVFKMRTDVDFSNAVSSLLKAFQKQSID
jgi:repressor LexA